MSTEKLMKFNKFRRNDEMTESENHGEARELSRYGREATEVLRVPSHYLIHVPHSRSLFAT